MSANSDKRKSRDTKVTHDQIKENVFISRRGSESPVKSLLIFQEKRKHSSPSSHNLSKKSSYSDLEDDESNIQLEELGHEVKNYSSMV